MLSHAQSERLKNVSVDYKPEAAVTKKSHKIDKKRTLTQVLKVCKIVYHCRQITDLQHRSELAR